MFATARRVFSLASFAVLFAAIALPWATAPARAADPIKIGLSMALTGGVAPNGKQLLLGLEIWRDDVNAKGGIMGRPVELIYYDDQSNGNNVPAIYTKLLSVDKVDLLLGPYATNMIAPAMPVIMAQNKMTIGMLGVNINRQFNYSRYFSMIPGGKEGTLSSRAAGSRSRWRRTRSRRASRSWPPTRNSGAPPATAPATTPRTPSSNRLRQELSAVQPPTSCRWCARSRPPIRTSSSCAPIRPTPWRSSAPPPRST